MAIRPIKISTFALLISLLFSSCFKDVDFGQAPDISMQPEVDIDLLVYQLNENDFIDSQTGAFTSIIRDTVRLEFLNDDYIQSNLTSVELRFRHENSFPVPIKSQIKFLDENGGNQFSIDYTIPAGKIDSTAVVDTIRVMQGSEIGKVKRSIQMALELEMEGGNKDVKGGLDFLSKGLFKFEF